MSVLDRVTTESDDSDDGRSRSGVFRRIMARDLYDVTKRVEALEWRAEVPLTKFLGSWLHVAPILFFLILFIGGSLYFDHRVAKVEMQQHKETLALRTELESKQSMINEMRQTVRQQAASLRLIAASSARAKKAAKPDAIALPKKSTASLKPRSARPAFLNAGEVLLIVASTLTRDDAIDQARTLELDGHASEVILGMSGYYGVALGRFDFEQAKSTKLSLINSGAANTPYLVNDESIDAYIYP